MDAPIVQYGVVRLPDKRVHLTTTDRETADAEVDRLYEWKAERRSAAEENRRELDAIDLPPTNIPWMDWTKATKHRPAIRDMEWEVWTRTVTAWEPVI